MPSPENTDLLDAMADQIRNVVASADVDVEVYGRYVASPPSYPAIDMFPGDLSRGTEARAFGTEGEFLFTVRVRVQTNDADENQELLLNMMDDINALSVPMALLDEPTLGGLAGGLDVVDPTGLVPYGLGEDAPIGFQFTAKVVRADS